MKDENNYFAEVKQYKMLAKHEVGQNFLVDLKIAKSIVNLALISNSDSVLEIGSGAGSLSYFIALSKAQATLIDIDEGLIEKLKSDFKEEKTVHPIQANALKIDLSPYTKIIGNLPYYITTSLLEHIAFSATKMKLGVFMIQKEAFFRISAPLGSNDYGPLPILLSIFFELKKEFIVARQAFLPSPHVDSIVFTLIPNWEHNAIDRKEFYRFLCALFIHRRKTILNNLTSFLGDTNKAIELLNDVKCNEKERPEKIKPEAFLKLFNLVKNRAKDGKN